MIIDAIKDTWPLFFILLSVYSWLWITEYKERKAWWNSLSQDFRLQVFLAQERAKDRVAK